MAAPLRDVRIELAEGLSYIERTENAPGSYEQYYALDYTPGKGTALSVLSSDTVWGRSDPRKLLKNITAQGAAVTGCVNADYFTMTTGVPEGILIKEGKLYCSDSWQNAIGINADGTVFIGRPELAILLDNGAGNAVTASYFNKLRTNKGIYLLSSDFGGETKVTGHGVNVLLKLDRPDRMAVGETRVCTVVDVTERTGAAKVEEGYLLLTASSNDGCSTLRTMQVGETYSIVIRSADKRWNGVQYACGANKMLVQGGKAVSGLSSSRTACTAFGIRADGSVVVLTSEGDLPGSAGSSHKSMAAELVSLGCTEAVNLDGGGSTTFIARLPGNAEYGVINNPTDGTVRACSDYLVFTNTAAKTGRAAHTHLSPVSAYALPGAPVQFKVTATDSGYYPVSAGGATLTASSGTVNGLTWTADALGKAEITAQIPDTTPAKAEVTVLSAVDVVEVRNANGVNVKNISADPGESVDLYAAARYLGKPVHAADPCFTWTVSGGIGSVSPEGVFTATAPAGMTGTLTASYGAKSATVNVTVGRLPEVLEGFEKASETDAAKRINDLTAVRYGKGAVHIDPALYSDPTEDVYSLGTIAIPQKTTFLTLMAHPDAEPVDVTLVLNDGITVSANTQDGERDADGWVRLVFAVPEGAKSMNGLKTSGAAAFDQLTAYPDAIPPLTCPEISQATVNGGCFTAVVTTDADYVLPKSCISVTGAGKKLDFTYDSRTGALTASVPSDVYRVTLDVHDPCGNLSRVTVATENAAQNNFADMNGHWAKNTAAALAKYGIVTGYTENGRTVFRPSDTTTREQAAVMLARALKLDINASDTSELAFADAEKISSWAVPYVRAVTAAGYINGSVSNGAVYFRPGDGITRAEVAAILGRAVARGYAANAQFTDSASIPAWAYTHFRVLHAAGIISGYEDGAVRPQNAVTRAELAAMLERIL